MRILMWLTFGFAGGNILCAYLLPRSLPIFLICIPGILGIALGILARGRKYARILALMLLGCSAGLAWFDHYASTVLSIPNALDGSTGEASIHITDYSYDTGYGTGADAQMVIGGKSYRVRVYLEGQVELTPGDEMMGTFRFRTTTPGGEKPASYLSSRGIFVLLYQDEGFHIIRGGELTASDRIAILRREITLLLNQCFPEDVRAFARALLLGDTYDLDYETRTTLKISGIWHVVSVSGLHVSILYAFISLTTLRSRFLTPLLGFPLLLAFAALAGFAPSIVRSCIMCSLMMLAQITMREYDGATALSFSVCFMLFSNPLTAEDVGFQLSVGSVAGIFLFSGRIEKWILAHFGRLKGRKRKLAKAISGGAAVSLSAVVLTTPLCAQYFGTVSLVGVMTNLATLPVVTAAFYGILGVCALYPVWQAGARILAQGISWLIRYALFVGKLLADLPLSAVYARSIYISAWLVFVYVLLVLFLVGKRRPRMLACCACLGLCAALIASWAEPLAHDTRLTVLDVGQGQCVLVQCRGRNYMVDCGGDDDEDTADIAAEYLLSQGIRRLDALIITHNDRDHAGAAGNLLTRVDADVLILSPRGSSFEDYDGGKILYAAQELELKGEGVTIRIFPAAFPGNSNETSLCVLFDTEKCDILITGDRNGFGERLLLNTGKIPEVDVLIAGHHGANSSTCEELLAHIRPQIVCISVGRDNIYGHPARELLERLAGFGCTVYRTDQNGTIIIRR